MSSTNSQRTTRIAAAGAALVAAAEIPWIACLAASLPATETVRHWPAAWVGLDVATVVGAATSAVLLARGHARADLALVATAALLVVDAWFDTTTAPATEVAVSVAEAALVELPLAAAAIVTALRVGHREPPSPEAARPEAARRERVFVGSTS